MNVGLPALAALLTCRNGDNIVLVHVNVRVNDFPAQIDGLVCTLQSRDRQELPLRKRFAAGSESLWPDLSAPPGASSPSGSKTTPTRSAGDRAARPRWCSSARRSADELQGPLPSLRSKPAVGTPRSLSDRTVRRGAQSRLARAAL